MSVRHSLSITALLLIAVGLFGPGPRHPDAAAQGSSAWARVAVWQASFDPQELFLPGGVAALPGGRLLVADEGHNRIAIVDAGGAVEASLGGASGAGRLEAPSDVAADPARDRVYVADRGNKRIAVFTLAGAFIGAWATAGPEYAFVPIAVAVEASTGDVLAASTSIVPRIERFSPSGVWRNGWGDIGLEPGKMIAPQDLTVHTDGRILVADSGAGRVQVFSASGDRAAEWEGLASARGVTLDAASGQVYVLAGQAGDEIHVLSSTGVQQRVVRSGSLGTLARFQPGRGLAVTGGRVAVTTAAGSPDGRQGLRQLELSDMALAAATVADPRDNPGFLRPLALDVGSDGMVHVLDTPVAVSKRYDPAGAFQGRAEAGLAHEIAVAADGASYVVDTRAFLRLQRLGPAGQPDWYKTCDCLSGMGLAASAQAVYATDAVSRAIRVFDLDPDRQAPIRSISIPDPPYLAPLDLDLNPAGELVVLDGLGLRVASIDPAVGLVARSFTLPAPADRLSVGPDGTIFLLFLDGSAAAYQPDGRQIQRWEIEPANGHSVAWPIDLAAGAGGRLYILDRASYGILVYERQTAVPPTATPPPVEAPCTATGDKRAAPGVVSLGQAAEITLDFSLTCRGGSGTRAEIVLIFDRSSSMASPGCSKLCQAQLAAQGFLRRLDLTQHRVAVVSFSDLVTLDLALSADAATISAAIDDVRAAGNTNIGEAMAVAVRHVAEAGREDAIPVYLLLTDGEPSGTEQSFVDAAVEGVRASQRGGIVYAIGLGANVNAELLTFMAGAPSRYFFAPSASDLEPIYDRLSQTIGGIVASDLVIDDFMGSEVELVPGSASAGPTVRAGRLTWDLGSVPAEGVRLTYRVTARSVGRHPTNDVATATYVVDGRAYEFVFPVPEIEVVAVATATPTREPTAGSRTYLPSASNSACLLRHRRLGMDAVLVIDVSSSMVGTKIEAAIQAAQSFVDLVDPQRDRVGAVAFSDRAELVYLISADLGAVRRALAGITTGVGTRIDLGLGKAAEELGFRAREGSQRVVILMSDGQPTGGSEAATRVQAAAVRGWGALYTIGLGADADMALMTELATGPAYVFYAPDEAALGSIYARIAERIPCR